MFVNSYNPTHPLDGSDTACAHHNSHVKTNKGTKNLKSVFMRLYPAMQADTHRVQLMKEFWNPYRTGNESQSLFEAFLSTNTVKYMQLASCKEVTFQGCHIKSCSV